MCIYCFMSAYVYIHLDACMHMPIYKVNVYIYSRYVCVCMHIFHIHITSLCVSPMLLMTGLM